MPDRSSRCNRPARFPGRGSSLSSCRRLASGSGPRFLTSLVLGLAAGFGGMLELYAESVESHGQQGVTADREDEIHALLVVETLAKRSPRLVGQLLFLVQLV